MKNIDGLKLKEVFLGGCKYLEANKALVDSLNVFPVPDGDTGTNMSMTMTTAVKEINLIESTDIDDIASAFAKGALKGARGNSGVILSQIIKGMCRVFSEKKEITSKIFAQALEEGAKVAYNAVTKPKEGTILTVIRVMAEKAGVIANKNVNIINFLESLLKVGEDILAETPNMLPVLKKAGVVDSGGKGLLCVFEGIYKVLIGEEIPESIDFNDVINIAEDFAGNIHDLEDIKYAYCTEYFVINLKNHTTEEDVEKLRDKLMKIGDSVIAIGDLNMVKVHVHTNNPNLALEYAIQLGEIDRIKIENMLEQNRELISKKAKNKKPIGVVAISTGEGIAKIFKDLNVDYIIEGGQTMNPSVEDILYAVEKVNSDNIIILPNNKNIILSAKQAVELTSKKVRVIDTVNVPQGISASIAFDSSLSIGENAENMTVAYKEIVYGEVTYAVRTTQMDGFSLKEGDIIGLSTKKIISKNTKVSECVKEVVSKIYDEDKSVISIYYGNGTTEEDANLLTEELQEIYPDAEVMNFFGGQPNYFYFVSLE